MTETGMIIVQPLAGPRRRHRRHPRRCTASRCASSATTARRRAPARSRRQSVEVRGPNVQGYWRMPRRRARSSPPTAVQAPATWAWVPTARRRGYLQLVGRAKDLIITGGLNVYPKEIEERIDAMDGVVESAVVGIPDPDFGAGGRASSSSRARRHAERSLR